MGRRVRGFEQGEERARIEATGLPDFDGADDDCSVQQSAATIGDLAACHFRSHVRDRPNHGRPAGDLRDSLQAAVSQGGYALSPRARCHSGESGPGESPPFLEFSPLSPPLL
jgi:hypothetical protein